MGLIDSGSKSSRLLASRRYTHNTFTTAQESFTNVLDLRSEEIYTRAHLIPSSSLPFSGSSQLGLTHSVNNQPVVKYWYRQQLTKSNTNNEVWFFLNPSGSGDGIGAQLINDNQQTNFVSPKYSLATLASSTTEDSTPGYLAVLYKSTAVASSEETSSLGSSDIVSTNDYIFDYKTGVVQFLNSTKDPSDSEYVYMTAYQYVGDTLKSGLEIEGQVSASNLLVTDTLKAGTLISPEITLATASIAAITASVAEMKEFTNADTISGSFTALSGSVATRFDSRETDMTLATASIAANETNMTLATASIAAITSSLSTISGTGELQGLGTTSSPLFNSVTASADVSASGNIYATGNLDIDGTSNFSSDVTIDSDLDVTGTITATEVHTTFISSSIAVSSGSNTFGDTTDDHHSFTGSLSVSSSLSVTGSVTVDGTLTADEIGAFTAGGAIDFNDQNMTNVDIDSGDITGVTFGTTTSTIISGSTTAVSSSIATRFDSREVDMTLATASIAAITASVSRIDSEIDTNAANMTLATASIAAITSSISRLDTESSLATASIEAITASIATLSGTGGQQGLGITNEVTFAQVQVDNFTLNGTELDLSSGDFTLDVAGDVEINADGGDIVVKDDAAVLFDVSATKISGSATSTGSFGTVTSAGEISASGTIYVDSDFPQLKLSDDGYADSLFIGISGDIGYIKSSDQNNDFKFRRSDNFDIVLMDMGAERTQISGSGGLDVVGHITASGNISSSGIIIADSFQSTGGDVDGISFADDLDITGNITASGGVSVGEMSIPSVSIMSSSIATRFDSREVDMTLATASIAAITASISRIDSEIDTNSANMTLATASIAAITASISRIDSEIDTNAANMTLATASIAAITASLGQPVNTDSAVTFNSVDADGGITIDNITIDGTEIDLSSGDFTLDVAGDVEINADGGDVVVKDDGAVLLNVSATKISGSVTSTGSFGRLETVGTSNLIGNLTLGSDLNGPSTGTGSFGRIESTTHIATTVESTTFACFTLISGSAVSTGSFGRVNVAGTLDAGAVTDELAAIIVTQIDNDEIPIAKLAEDSVTYVAGTGLGGGGVAALGNSATINAIGGNGITANANDLEITPAQTTIESIYKADLVIGEDAQTQIDFETANEIHFDVNNIELLNLTGAKISGSSVSTGSFGSLEVVDKVQSTLTIVGDTTLQNNLIVNGHITASGNISSSGIIIADTFQSTGGSVDGISFTDDLNITGNITASGGVSVGEMSIPSVSIMSSSIATRFDSRETDMTLATASIAAITASVSELRTHETLSTASIAAITASVAEMKEFTKAATISGSFTSVSSSIATRFDSRETDMTLATASIAAITASISRLNDEISTDDTDMNLATASIAAITSSIARLDSETETNDANMTLATASITAITASISRIDSEIDTNAANMTLATASISVNETGLSLATASIAAITASVAEMKGFTIASTISGSFTSVSSSIATRFDTNESNMTLATASIAALTASISRLNDEISTDDTDMTLATASIAAITASISRIDSEIDTNAANITLATASIAAITASLGQPVNTDSDVTFGDITSTGTITAVEIHTTFISSSISVATGSNNFGDDTSDHHSFTGSLSVSSSLSVTGSTTIDGTLTVDEIGAFTAGGAIDFGDQNMTNVDIDSGDITGVTFGTATSTTISGSTTAVSSSIATRFDLRETDMTLATASIAAITASVAEMKEFTNATTISGSFTAVSSSIATRFDTNESNMTLATASITAITSSIARLDSETETNDANMTLATASIAAITASISRLDSEIDDAGIFESTGSFYRTHNDIQITGSLSVSGLITGSYSGLEVGQKYKHSQDTAASTWTVSHGFDYQYVNIDVYNGSDELVIPASVVATDSNTITISFNTPLSGVAIVSTGGQAVDELGKNVIFEQPTVATNWRVTHSIGEQYPAVTVYDDSDNVIIPERINAVDASHMDIIFTNAVSGNANISVGGGSQLRLAITGSEQLSFDNFGDISGSAASTGSFGRLEVVGNGNIDGNLTLGGNITIGDADSDSITINADLTSNLVPNADSTYDIGSTSKYWRNAYIDTITTTGNISGSVSSTGSFGNVNVSEMSIPSVSTMSSSIATRFDSRETDMTLATASIAANVTNMTLATASIAAITASISQLDIESSLATASIAAITSSVAEMKEFTNADTISGSFTSVSSSIASRLDSLSGDVIALSIALG